MQVLSFRWRRLPFARWNKRSFDWGLNFDRYLDCLIHNKPLLSRFSPSNPVQETHSSPNKTLTHLSEKILNLELPTIPISRNTCNKHLQQLPKKLESCLESSSLESRFFRRVLDGVWCDVQVLMNHLVYCS